MAPMLLGRLTLPTGKASRGPRAAAVTPRAVTPRAVTPRAVTPRGLATPAVSPVATPAATPAVTPVATPATTPAVRGAMETELQLGAQAFDPLQPAQRSRLLAALGVDPRATVEAAGGFQGGLNEGVWFVRHAGGELVLKLVRASGAGGEADTLLRLQREHPAIASDPAVAFPQKIVRVLGAGGTPSHDLIVMSRAPGTALALVICDKWFRGQVREIMDVLQRVGTLLAQFHQRYGGKQHGDFQASNIFYDEATGRLTLIDLGGMGGQAPGFDVSHFAKSQHLLFGSYGPQFEHEGKRRFEQGYAGAPGARGALPHAKSFAAPPHSKSFTALPQSKSFAALTPRTPRAASPRTVNSEPATPSPWWRR